MGRHSRLSHRRSVASAVAAVGLGATIVGGAAPAAQAEPVQLPAQISPQQRDALTHGIDTLTKKLRDQLGSSVSNVHITTDKNGMKSVSWDIDPQKLFDVLGISPDDTGNMLVSHIPAEANSEKMAISVDGKPVDTTTLKQLADGARPTGAVTGRVPTADQLRDPKVREAFVDALDKIGKSDVWPQLSQLVKQAGGSEQFVDALNKALGVSSGDAKNVLDQITRQADKPVARDAQGSQSLFLPVGKDAKKVTISAPLADKASANTLKAKVSDQSTPFAFTIGDITFLDGKLDDGWLNYLPKEIADQQIGDKTVKSILTDVINSINDVLDGLRNRDNNGSSDNSSKPSESTKPSESMKPSESARPSESEKKDEDEVSADDARKAIQTLNQYVDQTEGKKDDKPSESTSPSSESAKPSVSEKTEASSSTPSTSNQPAAATDSSSGSDNSSSSDNSGGIVTDTAGSSGSSDAVGSSSSRNGGTAKSGTTRQATRTSDREIPPPTKNTQQKNYNAAAQDSMPVTGVSNNTPWILGLAIVFVLGGIGAGVWARRRVDNT